MLKVRRSFRRSAFSMLEVIGVVAVMAILAAVVIPALFSGIDTRAVASSKSTLDSLQAGINAFRVQTTHFPKYISMLSDSALKNPGPFDDNSCTQDIQAGQAPLYASGANEPFFVRVIPTAGGLPIGIGTIDIAIPHRTSTSADMFLVLRGVRVEDGQALNDLVDGTAEADIADGSNTAGNLRHPVPSADGTYTFVNFRVTRSTNDC